MRTNKLSANLGIEILDLDLSKDLDKKTTESIKDLFLQHQVLYFGQQKISPTDRKSVV